MAERVSLDDLDAELSHKLKACKDDQAGEFRGILGTKIRKLSKAMMLTVR